MAVEYILLHIVWITQYKFVLHFCRVFFHTVFISGILHQVFIIFVLVSNAAYTNPIMHLTFACDSPPCVTIYFFLLAVHQSKKMFELHVSPTCPAAFFRYLLGFSVDFVQVMC
jgi:hypothetical protein